MASDANSFRALGEFPRELLCVVCSFMSPQTLARFEQTNRYIRDVAGDDVFWSSIGEALYFLPISPGHSIKHCITAHIKNIIVVDPMRVTSTEKKSLFARVFGRRCKSGHFGGDTILSACNVYQSIVQVVSQQKKKVKHAGAEKHTAPIIALSPSAPHVEPDRGTFAFEKPMILVASHMSGAVVASSCRFSSKEKCVQVIRNVTFTDYVYVSSTACEFNECSFTGGVTVSAGSHVFVGGRVTRGGGVGVSLSAAARFTGVAFSGCSVGIEVRGGSETTFDKCTFNNNGNGLAVIKGGVCTLQHCTFGTHSNPSTFVKSGGTVSIEDCTYKDGLWGVVLRDDARASIKSTAFCDHRHAGVFVQTPHEVVIVRCTFKNERRGIVVAGPYDDRPPPAASPPALPLGAETEGEEAALFSCSIIDNEIMGCTRAGISLKNWATPYIARNHVHNGRWGLVLQKSCGGVIRGNSIHDHLRAGLCIRFESSPVVACNSLFNCTMGIVVSDQARGRFAKNDIYRNAHSGVIVKSGGCPTFIANKIYEEKRGINICVGGEGLFEGNDIGACTKAAVSLKPGVVVTITKNTIHNAPEGLYSDEAEGSVTNNFFHTNSLYHIFAKRGCKIDFAGNRFANHITAEPKFLSIPQASLESNCLQIDDLGVCLRQSSDSLVATDTKGAKEEPSDSCSDSGD